LFIELKKHPECLAELMTEINSVDSDDFTTVNSRMPYLNAVIMEINRLHPTVHATLRVINCKTKLATSNGPVVLKPDMLIYLSFLHLHTSPKFWGPNAGEFVPERFLGGYEKVQPFMPFGYGPRNCVSLPSHPNERGGKANFIRWDTNLSFLRSKCIS
jgi:cytochrome P450